jgi:thiol-disulfide isomerase/thioredoxin
MKRTTLAIVASSLILAACSPQPGLREGTWRAWIVPDTAHPSLEIPFRLDITTAADHTPEAHILNAGEDIRITEVTIDGDSVHFGLPVFESGIDARIGKGKLDGTYTHRGSGRSWTVPFHAEFGVTDRFPALQGKPAADLTGRWEVLNGPEGRAEKQIGEFIQNGNRLTGTILTTTGDYRYLEGKVAGNRMALSAFDGSHSLVFQADILPDGNLGSGTYCGGPGWKGVWTAVRNDTVTLPDPTTLTWLKPGYDRLDFMFPDLNGKPVSLMDKQFQGKPVIVQIMGSWCPNCMDEARFLSQLYDQYHSKGLQVIALCYESPDFGKSVKAIERFRDNTGAKYIFLYAGESNKRKAAETLPMLNRILSFPTCILIDRSGHVRRIFTGFSGPGTGGHYKSLTGEMEDIVRSMVSLGAPE